MYFIDSRTIDVNVQCVQQGTQEDAYSSDVRTLPSGGNILLHCHFYLFKPFSLTFFLFFSFYFVVLVLLTGIQLTKVLPVIANPNPKVTDCDTYIVVI